jgi:hypothetical protein
VERRGEDLLSKLLVTQRAIVFITLVGIAIALFSLRSLNHSVDVANQQAAAASTAAQAAVNANLESDRQFRLSERPWVGYTSLRNTGPIIFDKPRAAAHVNIHVTVPEWWPFPGYQRYFVL